MNANKQDELNFLKEVSLFIIDYFASITSGYKTFYVRDFIYAIESTYSQKDLKGMRLANKELIKMGKLLNPKDSIDLSMQLEKRFGINLGYKDQVQKIKQIMERGKINSKKEYDLLIDYLDILEGDEKKEKEIGKVFTIIEEYQLRR